MARMAGTSPPISPFLRLPRELRNEIYKYTTISVKTHGFVNGETLDIVQHCLPPPSLLRVNGQIHDELIEQTQSRKWASVDLRNCEASPVSGKSFATVREAHGNLKHLAFIVHWITVSDFGDDDDLTRFAIFAAEGGVSQCDIKWTPSKGR